VSSGWSRLLIILARWSGIDAILYYIGDVFQDLGLTGGTTALLATGVTGVVFFVSTLPAMVSKRAAYPRHTQAPRLHHFKAIIDSVGRKPMLIVGSAVMFVRYIPPYALHTKQAS